VVVQVRAAAKVEAGAQAKAAAGVVAVDAVVVGS
jgi:hypothetical protein